MVSLFFERNVKKPLKTSLNMKRHIVEIHMPWGCEVTWKETQAYKQLQDHKTEHSKLVVFKYHNDPQKITYVKKLPTFFRLLSRLNQLNLCGLF